jgi:hypothetical protein
MLDVAMYDLMMGTSGAIFEALQASLAHSGARPEPVPPLLQLRAGFAESPAWFLLQAAEFEPNPLTVKHLRVRDVYASERLVRALLELMASEQWLDRTEADAYVLTPAGRAVVAHILERRFTRIAALVPVPAISINRLESLLCGLIQASLATPTPPGTWCLAHSRNRAPSRDAAVLVRIAQYFEDFNAFRDDAHMAAWQTHGIRGFVWEAFALVCSSAAADADALFAALARRGYTRTEYSSALDELAGRGWLAPAGERGAYRVTELGHAVRANAERLTDSYFYAPWSRLSDHEVEEVRALLLSLRDALRALAVAS